MYRMDEIERRRAFTVLELVIVSCIVLMVVGMIGGMVSSVSRGMNRTGLALDQHEVLIKLGTRIRDTLQDSWAYELSPDGDVFRFLTPDGIGEIWQDRRRSRVSFRRPGGRDMDVVAPSLALNFRIEVVQSWLLRLHLDQGANNRGWSCDVRLPLREPATVPWNPIHEQTGN
jgi:hypothetical protein